MVTLYLEQDWLTNPGKVMVYNEYKYNVYQIDVKNTAFRCQVTLLDADTQEQLAQVKDALTPFLKHKLIYYDKRRIAAVRHHTVKRRPVYIISGLNWRIIDDFSRRQYRIMDKKKNVIAEVKKSWVFGVDTFSITIHWQDIDPVIVVAAVLAMNLSIALNDHYEVALGSCYGLE